MVDPSIREHLDELGTRSKMLRRQHTKLHYQELAEARSKGIPVCWTPAGMLTELLDAMGILACSPENYSAMCATRQLVQKYCDVAESHGISPDVCSYGKAIAGMMYEDDGPLGPMPRPDFVVNDPTLCDAHAKMWEVPANYFNVPILRVDGSFRLYGDVPQHKIDYRVAELKRVVRFCEDNLGVKLDYDRFKENVRISEQVRVLFTKMNDLRKATPCPRTARETSGDIFYIVTLPHRQEAIDYFTLVIEEMEARIQHKVGIVENEQFRLYYHNIVIWFWLGLFDWFAERGAAVAADSYGVFAFNGYHTEGGHFDPEKPFEAIAKRLLHIEMACGIEVNQQRYAQAIEEYKIDGAIFFNNRSCKAYTAGGVEKKGLFRVKGLPVMEFEGSHADPRSIDKAEVLDRASAFLEMLGARKKQSGGC